MSLFERLDSITNRDKYQRRSLIICVVIVVFVVATIATAIGIYGSGIRKKDPNDRDYNDGESSYRKRSKTSYNKRTPNLRSKTNILFITLDDLRPTLGCYGDKVALTPNIDQMAERGFIFTNAHAQQALCAPSRTSFLTSRRPDSLRLYDSGSYWRDTVGNFTTLPQYLKEMGYYTVSIGKVFHHGAASNETDDYPYSWSELPYRPSTEKYKMEKTCANPDGSLHMNLMCPVDVLQQPEKTLPDLQNLEAATAFLKGRALLPGSAPFFLAVGFYKPHIPFKFPKKYLDLYPPERVGLAINRTLPQELPDVAWNPWEDIRLREDVQELNLSFPYGPVPDDFQRTIRQGYYSSVSYVDDLIGQLLSTLEETGFSKDTAILLFGDHGWALGENQEWAKYSNFGVATRVPLIFVPPNQESYSHIPVTSNTVPTSRTNFSSVDHLIELVDLFPTIADMLSLEIPPACPQNETENVFCTEGQSFFPVLKDRVKPNEKSAIFTQFPRPSYKPQNNSDNPNLDDVSIMGYSMRTHDFRYSEWIDFDPVDFYANWGNVYAKELYFLSNDTGECNNVANDSQFDYLVKELSTKLRAGWRKA